jgi:hypothetical protein
MSFVLTKGGYRMEIKLWMWVAFAVFVAATLLVDRLVFTRRGERISLRSSVAWSVAWTALGLGFAGFVWVWHGRPPASEYLAGFLIEKSLSIDNLFVFSLAFACFGCRRRSDAGPSSRRSSAPTIGRDPYASPEGGARPPAVGARRETGTHAGSVGGAVDSCSR